MNAFLWFLFIMIAFWVVVRLFGKGIFRWFVRLLVKRAQKDLNRESRNFYEKTENGSPFEKNVYVDDLKVTVTKKTKEPKKGYDFGAEQVEFEEVE